MSDAIEDCILRNPRRKDHEYFEWPLSVRWSPRTVTENSINKANKLIKEMEAKQCQK